MSYSSHTLSSDVKHDVFLQPSTSNIIFAIQKVDELSPTQKAVLGYLTQGFSNKEIANKLSIATETVKAHCSCIFKKLKVSNRTQAAILGYLVSLQDLLVAKRDEQVCKTIGVIN